MSTLGEDLVEKTNDATRFRGDVLSLVRDVFPEGTDDCIERIEGAGHGSDALQAVLSPVLTARFGPLQRKAPGVNMVATYCTSGTVVGDGKGGLTSRDAVVVLTRYRRPRTAVANPACARILYFALLCLSTVLFVHFVWIRERA